MNQGAFSKKKKRKKGGNHKVIVYSLAEMVNSSICWGEIHEESDKRRGGGAKKVLGFFLCFLAFGILSWLFGPVS